MTEFFISNNGDTSHSDLSLLTKVAFTITRSIPLFHLLQSPILLVLQDHHPWQFLACWTHLLNFKKGTKRDLPVYPTFKNEYYNTFCHSFHATTRAQGLRDILIPKCHLNHSDNSAQLLLTEQQAFMYYVQVVSLQTKRGKEQRRNSRMMHNESL